MVATVSGFNTEPCSLRAILSKATHRLAAHIFDDLTERGKPVVAVCPLRSRLNLNGQAGGKLHKWQRT